MYNLEKEGQSSCHNQAQQVKGSIQRKQEFYGKLSLSVHGKTKSLVKLLCK